MVSTGNRSDSELTGIELRSVSKSFGKTEVLRDLFLSIRESELCCLLGPSGCGKTTALKIINGLLEADSGSVFILGSDVTNIAPQKRNLGMVFQNYALFPHLSVLDNIAYGLRRRKVSSDAVKEKVASALDLVQLHGVEKRRIHELSGGQQQRVALARALVIEPRALLLDEPLSNLDAKLRAEMRDEIRRLQTQLGITTVYVTHDQEEAMSIADRIVVMNNGVIEQIGTPHEIYEYPSTPFVASFVGTINFIPGVIANGSLTVLGEKYPVPEDSYPNGAFTCAVRPERIDLSVNYGEGISGEIGKVSFLGSIVRYEIMMGTHELSVQVPVSSELYETGQKVSIRIKYEDIRLFAGTVDESSLS